VLAISYGNRTDPRAAEVFDVLAIMLIIGGDVGPGACFIRRERPHARCLRRRAHALVIGRRDRHAAASPRTSRTRHFCTVRNFTTFFAGSPLMRRPICAAHLSNAALRSGISWLLL
jgi:hypothetical protein